MGYFKVTVDPTTGLKDIQQIPTPEDARVQAHVDLDAEIDARLEADLEVDTSPELTVEDGGAADDDPPADEAANKCMAGLYEQNVSWAKKLIVTIQTQAGIAAVREMEKAHPEHKERGGRSGVLNALQERSGEIMEGQTKSDGLERGPGSIEDPPETTMGTGLPCGECEFTAGSDAGLESHMETHHPDAAAL